LTSEVFVVYRHVLGACDALFVYAICTSKYGAEAARRKATGFRIGSRYFDADPASTPYATQLRILKVQTDRLYPLGVFSKSGQGSKEVIA
jgi:hypothetical protein